MRKLLLLLALSLPLGAANFAFVQTANSIGATSGARAAVFATNNTAGNIIIAISYGANVLPTDTQGNTYTLIPSGVGTGMYIYWAGAIHGGANTVSMSTYSLVALEYSSISATYCVLQGGNQTGGTTQIHGGTYTSGAEAMAIFTAENCCNPGPYSLTNGTIRADLASTNPFQAFFVGDEDVASVPSAPYLNNFTPYSSASLAVFISQTGCPIVPPTIRVLPHVILW